MKKTMRWIALVLVAVMLCLMLVSCAKTLSGTYTAGGSVFGTGGEASPYAEEKIVRLSKKKAEEWQKQA